MKGVCKLVVWSRYIRYELEFKRRISVIKGNGGTGKSTLVDMTKFYIKKKRGYNLQTTASRVRVLDNDSDWQTWFKEDENCLYIADEDFQGVYSRGFSKALRESSGYFVYITRSSLLGSLNYSIDSIYILRAEKRGQFVLNKLYNYYVEEKQPIRPALIITEDTKSGHDIIEHVVDTSVQVIGAGGNSKINTVMSGFVGQAQYVIVDGAAYGSFIAESIRIANINNNIRILAPECFEYLVLQTSYFKKFVTNELSNPELYANASEYATWENYFEALLRRLVQRYRDGHYNKEDWGHLYRLFRSRKFLQEIAVQLYDLDSSVIRIGV